MKRVGILAVVLLLTAVISLGIGFVALWNKDDVTETTDFVLRKLEDGNYEITSLVDSSKEKVEIPDTYNNKKIVGIGEKAFQQNKALTEIKLGANVKYIGNNAYSPNSITLSGIVMLFSSSHLLKALPPILSSPLFK